MEIHVDDVLVFRSENSEKRGRVSSIDGRLVKILEEGGTYNQIPYKNLMEMFESGFVRVANTIDL